MRIPEDLRQKFLTLALIGKYRPTRNELEGMLDFDIESPLAHLMGAGTVWEVDGRYVPGVRGSLTLHEIAPRLFESSGLPR